MWYLQGSVGYYHLGAFSPLGYELRSSFALFSFAINYFADSGLRWLDLGAGARVKGSETDGGLSRFKALPFAADLYPFVAHATADHDENSG